MHAGRLALWWALSCSALAAGAAVARGDEPSAPTHPLDATTFATWHAYLSNTAEETRFERIPWRPTLSAGVRDAVRDRKPLLLWVMNGHPLGCT